MAFLLGNIPERGSACSGTDLCTMVEQSLYQGIRFCIGPCANERNGVGCGRKLRFNEGLENGTYNVILLPGIGIGSRLQGCQGGTQIMGSDRHNQSAIQRVLSMSLPLRYHRREQECQRYDSQDYLNGPGKPTFFAFHESLPLPIHSPLAL